jgi:hypothetical protein
MKRIHVLAVALAAVFVASVAVVSTASAVEFLLALWLEGTTGTPLTTYLLVEMIGELELIDTKTLFGESRIKCSGILEGNIGPESLDQISDLLNLAKELISLAGLVELGLACTDISGFCPEPLVWAEGLPWETQLDLMVENAEEFFADLLFIGQYEVKCMAGAFITEDLCESPEVAVKATNVVGGTVDLEFSDAFQELAGLKLGTCALGGAESAVVTGLGELKDPATTITVSE